MALLKKKEKKEKIEIPETQEVKEVRHTLRKSRNVRTEQESQVQSTPEDSFIRNNKRSSETKNIDDFLKSDRTVSSVVDSDFVVNNNNFINSNEVDYFGFGSGVQEESAAEEESGLEDEPGVQEESGLEEETVISQSLDKEIDYLGFSNDTIPDLEDKADLKSFDSDENVSNRKSHNVFDFLQNAVNRYCSTPVKHSIDSVDVHCENEDVFVRVQDDGSILLPNCRVYKGVKPLDWDSNFEVKIPMGDTVELDLGLYFTLPAGYGLKIMGTKELLTKFGLLLPGGEITLSQSDMQSSIIIPLSSCTHVAYVARYQSVLKALVVKL